MKNISTAPNTLESVMKKMEILDSVVTKKVENETVLHTSDMSKAQILKNLFVLCFSFLFVYSEFQALANLQSTMNAEGNVGVTSQTVYCACSILSSLFLPKLLIKKIGCKVTIVLCIILYVPFILANLYPYMETLVPTVVIQAIGAAPLFAAKSTYFNQLSVQHAKLITDDADVIAAYYFGIFYTTFQSAHIWGNLISYYVLMPLPHNESSIHYRDPGDILISNITTICGADYCSGENENLKPPPDEKRYLLIGIFLGCVIPSALLVAVFLDPLERTSMTMKDDDGVLSKVIATVKHLRKLDMLLLVPLTIFLGIEESFILAEFSKAYVACSWGLHNVGRVFICFGVTNAITSFVAGRLVKYVPRWTLMMTGALSNGGASIALFLWKPNEEEYMYFFLIIGAWGLSDAIWLTQINAFYGSLFRSDEEAAFANYMLWYSLGFTIAYGYSPFLCITGKIYILLFFLLAGMAGYFAVELRSSYKKRNYKVRK